MKKKICLVIALSLIILTSNCTFGFQKTNDEVRRLDSIALSYRQSDPKKTETIADSAFKLAQKLKDDYGMAESSRAKGVGLSYQKKITDAYDFYYNALVIFKRIDNKKGIAKVNNNIGNLYREDNYDKALSFYKDALAIAIELKDNRLIASVNVNMGNVYLRQEKYNEALSSYLLSQNIYAKIPDQHKTPDERKDVINLLQNTGVTYNKMRQYDKAQALLLRANDGAKELNMKSNVASIGITLAELSIATNKFDEAERYITEGLLFIQSFNGDEKKEREHDYNYTSYQLELKRKNYERAVKLLAKIYSADSSNFRGYVSQQLTLAEKNIKQKDLEVTIEQQKKTQYLFWGTGVATVLLIIVVVLLVANVRRKNQSNLQLTALNAEVSLQKDNVDKINKHLEEIIDERTKDLQIKNKKLAEHSSYLSHQIRGPIATLKGLMNLEKEGLVDQEECIVMMNRCVSEIDDKIIDMSDMLHDPGRTQ